MMILSTFSFPHLCCFWQIDVDIGSSSVARSVIGLVLGYVTSLVVDLAVLIEVSASASLVRCSYVIKTCWKWNSNNAVLLYLDFACIFWWPQIEKNGRKRVWVRLLPLLLFSLPLLVTSTFRCFSSFSCIRFLDGLTQLPKP